MSEEQTDDRKQGLLGEPFPNPLNEDPTIEESTADFELQADEERGGAKPPWKTAWFWISFVSMNLSFLMAAEVLSAQIQEWVVIAVTSLAHLGYGVTVEYFRRHSDQLHTNKPAYQRPAFWASWAANLTAFGLGSGHPEMVEWSAQIALILSYLGVATRARIRRTGEVDPETQPYKFLEKVLTLLVGLLTRKKNRKP